MVYYSEPHNAGHEFHRYRDPCGWAHERRRARGMEGRTAPLYQALDAGVGDLIAAAGDPLDVLVFSGMGMRRCTSEERLLERGPGRARVPGPPPPGGRTGRGRSARSAALYPGPFVTTRTYGYPSPPARRSWRGSGSGRPTGAGPRAYAEAEPGVGYVHLNVRGRDPEGIVAPGPEYQALCDEVANELPSLREVESGEPAVVEVLRPGVEALPDLVVRFSQERLLAAVRHPRLGVVREDVADTPYSEHTGEGFLVAAGPGIRPRGDLGGGPGEPRPDDTRAHGRHRSGRVRRRAARRPPAASPISTATRRSPTIPTEVSHSAPPALAELPAERRVLEELRQLPRSAAESPGAKYRAASPMLARWGGMSLRTNRRPAGGGLDSRETEALAEQVTTARSRCCRGKRASRRPRSRAGEPALRPSRSIRARIAAAAECASSSSSGPTSTSRGQERPNSAQASSSVSTLLWGLIPLAYSRKSPSAG